MRPLALSFVSSSFHLLAGYFLFFDHHHYEDDDYHGIMEDGAVCALLCLVSLPVGTAYLTLSSCKQIFG